MRARILYSLVLAMVACDPPHAPSDGSRNNEVEDAPADSASGENTASHVELVVLIVIDQLPSWSFTQDLPRLRGGLARIAASGYYAPYAQIPYATTATAPGHAALATGAPPRVTGILDNAWYRRERGAAASVTDDPRFPIFSVRGRADPSGASPLELPVPAVADLVTASGGLAVSVGAKRRAAVLIGGRQPTVSVFYDADQAAMTTSSYYTDALPAWLEQVNRTKVQPYLESVWEPLDPKLLAEICGPDRGPGEGQFFGLDATFPHNVGATEAPGKALRATPFMDELVFDTATAALDGVGLGEPGGATDYLMITLAGHDYAGHVWGQESWERRDVLQRIDRRLGAFLAELDERFPNAYRAAVTSDHGATPLVERSIERDRPAHRTDMHAVVDSANRAAETVLGPGRWALGWWANSLYMSDSFLAQAPERRSAALDAVVEVLRDVPGMGYVSRTDQISGDCNSYSSASDRLACRAVLPARSGEVFCTVAAYCVPFTEFATGTAHDSPNPEDRIVPIMMMGPGIERQVDPNGVSLLRVAPTIAQLLGVPAPAAAEEPGLF